MPTLRDIFTPSYGNKFDLNKMARSGSAGGVAFVSRTRKNLGVVAYVEAVSETPPYPAGNITIALGGVSVLEAFVQPREFYTAQNVAVLTPKVQLTLPQLQYYCLCIRHNRHRYYGFGREANRTFRDIPVPAVDEIPAWASAVSLPSEIENSALGPQANLAPEEEWKYFELGDLFEIKKGKRLTKANMKAGRTPFIGAVDNNNGLTNRISLEAVHPANTITVNYNGNGVAEAYYQPQPYRCSDDVHALYPKFEMDPWVALFLCAVIKQEKYRFSYGRKWHLERMRSARIKLPSSGPEPAWEQMRSFMRGLPYSKSVAALGGVAG